MILDVLFADGQVGRPWVKRAASGSRDLDDVRLARGEIDEGQRPGVATDERERLKQLERENRELRRANEILKSASAFFAAELDGRPR